MENDKIFNMLRSSVLFCELSDGELTELLPLLNPKRSVYSAGAVLEYANEVSDTMYIIESGEIAAQRATFSGNIYISHVYQEGELIGPNGVCSSPGTWPLTFVALIKSTALTFSARWLLSPERENSTLRERFFHALLQGRIDCENRALIQKISRSAVSTRGKLLTFFDLMQDKHNSNVFPLRMKREELATFLDMGRSSVFRELKLLADDGIVVIGKDRMVTVDNEKLRLLQTGRK